MTAAIPWGTNTHLFQRQFRLQGYTGCELDLAPELRIPTKERPSIQLWTEGLKGRPDLIRPSCEPIAG
jgi:hypothetical protein